jgi:putative CocE/NonD family hydrolase
MNSDSFPLGAQQVSWTNYYLHQDGGVDNQAPIVDEGSLTYEHDPNLPVLTIGGANMLVRTPQDDRYAQGQMNYADSNFAPYTMSNPAVLSFESANLNDTLSMIGFPKATLYVSSAPQSVSSGLTDTDFFVRILDVYPDGRTYNVVEGAVNARARAYARSIYQGHENDTAAFSNINIGQIYELQLEMLPIAYTFGVHHRIKVLISSSNFPRYQSNANIPIEPGEFLRRNPNDGQSYTYQNQIYTARKADNSLYFSTQYPSRIELPIYQQTTTAVVEINTSKEAELMYSIAPNPTSSFTLLRCPTFSTYRLQIIHSDGQIIQSQVFEGHQQSINLKNLATGVYFIQVNDLYQPQQAACNLKLIKY